MMHWETVTPLLKEILETIIAEPMFQPFRLVGGTSLSLQYGHRMSVDIDLFTDAEYGSIDFTQLDQWFSDNYEVVSSHHVGAIGFGKSYYIGHVDEELVKVDLYYTEPFIQQCLEVEGIRMADPQEIIAMKMGIVGRGGRKKDFWDLHEASNYYSIQQMIGFYHEREPYGHSEEELRKGLTDFSFADDDFEPVCLRGKQWEMIKYDLVQWLKTG